MKKNEMIKAVAEKMGTTQKEAVAAVEALEAVVNEAMVARDEVKVLGVTFKTKDIAEKSGTIQLGDRKGETWTKPAHTEVTVKVGSVLKNLLAD